MDSATQTMIDNILKNTGKPFEEWLEIVKQSGLTKHGEIVKYLKDNHAFTHGYANLVAHKAKGSDAGSVENQDDLVSNQYEGKEGLKEFYDKLISEIQSFGADVELAPKNAYVSVRRKKQFALIQPTTKTRLDLGLNIKGKEPEGKLEKSGSFNAMCSHRVRIESASDITSEVIGWLKEAYDNAG
ncbi:MAG: DUF4287 domain-containing protein [Ignavibacteriaceae bacterium]|nr:DUF4287 domain-containing protein [Ignavibacteriaceae bacterium]